MSCGTQTSNASEQSIASMASMRRRRGAARRTSSAAFFHDARLVMIGSSATWIIDLASQPRFSRCLSRSRKSGTRPSSVPRSTGLPVLRSRAWTLLSTISVPQPLEPPPTWLISIRSATPAFSKTSTKRSKRP